MISIRIIFLKHTLLYVLKIPLYLSDITHNFAIYNTCWNSLLHICVLMIAILIPVLTTISVFLYFLIIQPTCCFPIFYAPRLSPSPANWIKHLLYIDSLTTPSTLFSQISFYIVCWYVRIVLILSPYLCRITTVPCQLSHRFSIYLVC